MVICLELGADLHMSQLMPMSLTFSCFSKIQIGFTFLVLAHLGSPGKRAVKRVCVCVCAGSPAARRQQLLIDISSRAPSSICSDCLCCCQLMGQTDAWTDGRLTITWTLLRGQYP